MTTMQRRKVETHIVQSHSQDIPVSALYSERWRYEDSPPFQRDHIWPEKMKRNLIDSILRGFYVPAILAYPFFDPQKGQKYWVVDGQQRLHTIFEFIDGKFRTGHTSNADEPYYAPLEPHKLFTALSMEAQEQLRSYPIRVIILDDVPDELLGVMFRRLQNQMPLTASEKLWSYMSEATRQATHLAEHDFFRTIYTGRKTRKEPFHAAIYALMVELAGGFVNVAQAQIRRVAAGQKDADITSHLTAQVERRLSVMQSLLFGVQLPALLEVFFCYQTMLLLEVLGYDIEQSAQGCLTPWMKRHQEEQLFQKRDKGFASLFFRIMEVSQQKHFWYNNLAVFADIDGLVTPNRTYTVSQTQRVLAWIKQSGVCLECGKSARLLDINSHIFRHEDRYNSQLQTCVIHSPVSEIERPGEPT